jgi:hypothetical protein
MTLHRCLLPALLLTLAAIVVDAHAQDKKPGKMANISWKRIVLDREFRSEGAGVADVNKDGKPDVIVGDCWYEAPKDPTGPWKRHILRADRKFDPLVYSKSFCCFPDDFNGDGWVDVIVIPFPGDPCYWYQNPGEKGGLWKEHLLTGSACNETPIYVDLFKTGKKHLVMGWNPPRDDGKKGNFDDRGEICYFLPGRDPTQPWQRISISGPSMPGKAHPGTGRFAHGLGAGDVNGDGRLDIIVPQGWWEQPAKAGSEPWKFHAANITDACADMYALDIDGDNKSDIVSTSAHNYGFWWSQQKDANSFLQRPLFMPPSEVAKLPKDHGLNAEEKALFDAVNKLRNDQYKRAPFALDPELSRLARTNSEIMVGGLKKNFDIPKHYSGKVIHISTTGVATAETMKETVLQLLPDNEKVGQRVQPHFVIGIGAMANKNGKTYYTLILGDKGRFSLPSQTHALHHVDIDGDGLKDLVTGRRWWAHGPKGDAGPNDPAYLYWFQAKRDKEGAVSFTPHLIDDESGVGTQFAVADMNGDGLLDIIISNKRGVFILLQGRGAVSATAPNPGSTTPPRGKDQ